MRIFIFALLFTACADSGAPVEEGRAPALGERPPEAACSHGQNWFVAGGGYLDREATECAWYTCHADGTWGRTDRYASPDGCMIWICQNDVWTETRDRCP